MNTAQQQLAARLRQQQQQLQLDQFGGSGSGNQQRMGQQQQGQQNQNNLNNMQMNNNNTMGGVGVGGGGGNGGMGNLNQHQQFQFLQQQQQAQQQHHQQLQLQHQSSQGSNAQQQGVGNNNLQDMNNNNNAAGGGGNNHMQRRNSQQQQLAMMQQQQQQQHNQLAGVGSNPQLVAGGGNVNGGLGGMGGAGGGQNALWGGGGGGNNQQGQGHGSLQNLVGSGGGGGGGLSLDGSNNMDTMGGLGAMNNNNNNSHNNSSNNINGMTAAQQQQQHNNALLLGTRSSSISSQQGGASQQLQQLNNMNSNNNAMGGGGGGVGMGGPQAGAGGGTNDTASLQQQIANLQRQLQQQQGGGGGGGGSGNNSMSGGGMSGNNNALPNKIQTNLLGGRQSSASSLPTGNFQQQQQQQQRNNQNQNTNNSMFGSMDGSDSGGNGMLNNNSQRSNPNSGMGLPVSNSNNNMNNNNNNANNNNNNNNNDPFSSMMMGSMSGQTQLQGHHDSLNQNDLLRQQKLLGNTNLTNTNNNNNNMMNNNNNNGMMGRRTSADMSLSNANASANNNNNNNNQSLDGSSRSQHSGNDTSSVVGSSGTSINGPSGPAPSGGAGAADYLGGSFAGGWQSNADLPDRRRIIFTILEVIRLMRPDTNRISQKLPHMAKSLEEHLYRSASTKEEYMDQTTLRDRLQKIAQGLESHQSKLPESQQLQEILRQGGNNNTGGQGTGSGDMNQFDQGINNIPGMGGVGGGANGNSNNLAANRRASAQAQIDAIARGNLQQGFNGQQQQQQQLNAGGGGGGGGGDPQKVIRQQQQRLLLLRHASKCKMGSACATKFCAQMKPLWQHMKKCRDKDCSTRHCQSSRCVLTHYRICKSQGKTATCEICGPVMEHIRKQEANEGLDSSNDPLTEKTDPADLPSHVDIRNISVFGADIQKNAQIAQEQLAREQARQLQHPNDGGIVMPAQLQNKVDLSTMTGNPQQVLLQQLQQAQLKFQQQQLVLNKLKNQLAQLLEQQKQLQIQQGQGQQGHGMAQQLALLQQLQQRTQRQQALEYTELMNQHRGIAQMQMQMKAMQQQNQQQTIQNAQQQQQQQNIGSSQRSQHSQNSNGSQHSNNVQQLQQQEMLAKQAQQQALQQQEQQKRAAEQEALNRRQSMNENTNINTDNLNELMDDPLQSEGNLDALDATNLDDSTADLELPEELGSLDQPIIDTPKREKKIVGVIASEAEHLYPKPSEEVVVDHGVNNKKNTDSAPLDDNSEHSTGSKSKKRKTTASAPSPEPAPSPAPVATIGILDKVPRGGRGGGKGKRLREIEKINMAEGEANGTSLSGNKRSMDDMNKNGPSPDTETSGGVKNKGSSQPSLPKGDVEQHLLMLNKGLHLTSRTITHKCLPIVQQLIDDPYGWVFRDAVDPVLFGLPDYFEVVKNPMHLLLVKKKLENAVYTDMASFERDVKLVFENAILYNGEESDVGTLAKTMKGVFETEYKKVCEECNDLIHIDPDACKLCGTHSLQFEPPVLLCSGMSCGMSRITRNAVYYTDAKNRNNWCDRCYTKLSPTEHIVLDDGSQIKKSRLKFTKNDSLPEEVFLQCHDCKGQVHQICALYNCRCAKPNEIFRCPKCINVYKDMNGIPSEVSPKSSAENLPKCSMSDFIQDGLLKSLDIAYEKTASESGVNIDHVEKAGGISVRVMSHVSLKHVVRDEMYKRYSKHGYPTDFPVHTKCVGLFQSIDGVDVLLFAMYVYEYGHECPAPNRRRVYISYLDSVKYFEPKQYRSIAYQSIIVEYLRFVKKRGFHTAHIWSCPPAPDDEYVFHCHPPQQKVPKEKMLRQWYYSVIDEAKAQGIVVETTDLYEEYFNYRKWGSCGADIPNPMSLPYFEGDYVPGEIETILSKLNVEDRVAGNQPKISSDDETSNVGGGSVGAGTHRASFTDATGGGGVGGDDGKPQPQRRHSSGMRSGTRSNPGQLVNQTHDKVMNRLGMAINNMKENLIVVRLRNRHFALAVDRGDDVSEWPDDDEYSPEILSSNYVDELDRIKKSLSNSTKIGSTIEEDEQFESEMFENRQLFLSYCQGNHCQFDEIRRAKYSTTMVLYQLHNPSAPKFVRQCGACQRDIGNVGSRYRCNVCTDFDLCSECFPLIKSRSKTHKGSRFVHPKSHTFSLIKCTAINKNAGVTVTISAADRAKTLKAYLKVLDHAAYCGGPQTGCQLKNCAKMKQLFVHVKSCPSNMQQCKICARLLSLIIVHARSCTVRDDSCPLPYCNKIRERNKRLRRQQRFMDDRRRQAQNAFYQQD